MRNFLSVFVMCGLIATLAQSSVERDATDVPLTPSPAFVHDTLTISGDSATAVEALGRAIRGELGSRGTRRSICGVKIYNLTGNRDVFTLRGTEPLTPASTMKLITSSTALGLFGASYKVPTEILADTLSGSIVNGNLYLRGHGDPTFSAVDLDSLIDILKKKGIKKITGDIVGDATFFDDVVDRSEYSGDGEMVEELPPISALTINRNRVTVVAHAAASGERVRVQTVPRVPCIALSSSAMSVSFRRKGSGARGQGLGHKKSRKHRIASVAPSVFQFASFRTPVPEIIFARHHRSHGRTLVHHAARAGGLRFGVFKGKEGKQSVVVSGALIVGGTSSRVVELYNPPLAAASMLKSRLESEGIAIDGEAITGETPISAVKVAVKETPLVDICAMLNKHSDNFAAEQLFKMIGATCCGVSSPVSCCIADSSVKYINLFLTSCKVNAKSCAFHDGSGLSHHAAITPDAKVALLKSIHSKDTLFKAFYNTLAIGGVDGTIRGRMKGTPAENNVHAKTGTLNGVTALAGYVTTKDGELWAFDITMNSAGAYGGRKVQDKIVERLAGFSYAAAHAAAPSRR